MTRPRAAERGSALIIALLVTFILSILGASFVMMAHTEGRIAENERRALQTLYLAEAGARVVQGWFDRPDTAFGFPPESVVLLTQRVVLDPDDPYEGPPLTGAPLYKDGTAARLFDPPYRGDFAEALMGRAEGPDMRIEDPQFLRDLSAELLGTGLEQGATRARLARIEIAAPPYVRGNNSWGRYGIATVRVLARLYRLEADVEVDILAEQGVTIVLNEIPYRDPVFGPLHVIGDLTLSGRLEAHWGPVTVNGSVHGYSQALGNIDPSLPRKVPHQARIDEFWRSEQACFDTFSAGTEGQIVYDPWLRVVAGLGGLDVSTDSANLPDEDCSTPGAWDCCTDGNKAQNVAHIHRQEYRYPFWKNVATSGARNVFYFVPSGTRFRENNIGPELSFEQATNGRSGIFFFDTTDGRPPHDDDGDGELDNLSLPLTIQGSWESAGFVFLNAESITLGNLSAASAVPLYAPGEPFEDLDRDFRWDDDEPWFNLDYPSSLTGGFVLAQNDGAQDDGGLGTPTRNSRAPLPIEAAPSFRGIFYSKGAVTLTGTGLLYGSVISGGDVGVQAGSPDIYWADEITTFWPPPDLDLPRVTITRWTEEP